MTTAPCSRCLLMRDVVFQGHGIIRWVGQMFWPPCFEQGKPCSPWTRKPQSPKPTSQSLTPGSLKLEVSAPQSCFLHPAAPTGIGPVMAEGLGLAAARWPACEPSHLARLRALEASGGVCLGSNFLTSSLQGCHVWICTHAVMNMIHGHEGGPASA